MDAAGQRQPAGIFDFHKVKVGEKKARAIVEAIVKMPHHLSVFPKAGAEALKTGNLVYRQVVTKRYKMYYSIETEAIYIHLVWDTRRDPQTLHQRLTQKQQT